MDIGKFWMGDLNGLIPLYDKILYAENAKMEGKVPAEALQAPSFNLPFQDEEEDEEDRDDPLLGLEYLVQKEGSLASINVEGSLLNNSSWFTRWLGIPTYQDIIHAARVLDADPEIEDIILNLNTPGGVALGVDEAGAALSKVEANGNTSIRSHTSGMAASAGIWLATSVKNFTASKMSLVGSIGVIQIHTEISKQLKEAGVGVTVFREGKFKALMNSFEPLTEDAIAENDKKMKFLNDQFISQVAIGRSASEGDVRENMADGREFFGVEAVRIGLVDSVATFEEVVNTIQKSHNDENTPLSASGGTEMSLVIKKEKEQKALEAKELADAAKLEAEQAAELEAEEAAKLEAEEAAAKLEEESSEETSEEEEEEAGAEEEDEVEASSETSEEEEEEETGAEANAGSTPIEMQDPTAQMLVELSAKNESMKQELSLLKSGVGANAALLEQLTVACTVACVRMGVALNTHVTNLDKDKPQLVLETFNNLNENYMKSFKVGSQSSIEEEEEENSGDGTLSSMDVGKVSATSFSSTK